jgi:Kef-type K+ transport system membrane component KefB
LDAVTGSVPAVIIGQSLAGIVLGPSLLERLPGYLTGRLFPNQALAYLTVLSQVSVDSYSSWV